MPHPATPASLARRRWCCAVYADDGDDSIGQFNRFAEQFEIIPQGSGLQDYTPVPASFSCQTKLSSNMILVSDLNDNTTAAPYAA